MVDDEMLDAVRRATAEVVDCPPESVSTSTSLRDDLEADSVDLVEIAHGIEQRLGRPLDHDELADVDTVAELLDYLGRAEPPSASGEGS